MKRSWISIIAVVGFIGLLLVLGVLQYRWLSQVSEADLEKQQKRLEADTENFAADFNREIQAAYFNFQTGSDDWKRRDFSEFNERFAFWKGKTGYPSLIKSVVFVENKAESEPLVYDPANQNFVVGDVPADFAALRKRFTDDKSLRPVYEDVPALVMPIHDHRDRMKHILVRERGSGVESTVKLPPKYGYLVIYLDAATITQKVLPEMSAKYFPDGDYNVSVSTNDGNPVFRTDDGPGGPDASVKLFDLSPEKFMFFSNRESMPRQGEQKRDVFISRRVESRTVTSNIIGDGNGGMLKFDVQSDGGSRMAVLEQPGAPAADGFWSLNVRHRDGSLANFVASNRQRSLAISFGLLTLLAAAVLLIFVSAHRARRFAQRQLDFVSSVSHEFRTPLAVIYSAGENLADGIASEKDQVSRYGTMIKGEGKKLSGMVEQILEFAGADSGRRKFNFRKIEVADVLRNALDECMPMFHEKGFEVETDFAPDLPPITADSEALSGAIQNLLRNSAKYCNGTKWLRLSADEDAGRVKIVVEDRGIGISSSDLRRIFQPFYRARSVVDAQIHGNGLGLSLVKQIADAHGGRVYAESEVGNGSRFTIELAAVRD